MVLLPCRIAAMVARNASVSALIWLIGLPLPLFQEIFTCFNRRRLSVPLPGSEHNGASFSRHASTAGNNVVLTQNRRPVTIAGDNVVPDGRRLRVRLKVARAESYVSRTAPSQMCWHERLNASSAPAGAADSDTQRRQNRLLHLPCSTHLPHASGRR